MLSAAEEEDDEDGGGGCGSAGEEVSSLRLFLDGIAIELVC